MNLGLLAPELSLLIGAILVIITDLFVKQKGWLVILSLAALAVSGAFLMMSWGTNQTVFNNMLVIDPFAQVFKLLFLGAAVLVVLASVDYVLKFERFQGEYYALILISVLGMTLMAGAAELISIFVALELTSISLYALVGFLKDSKSSEASLKYLLLGAVASAILLYGMALIFGVTGETLLANIAGVLRSLSLTGIFDSPALALGIVLLIVGFGFKIAAFPFQMWVPDVYEGAPTPITAYLSVAGKAAGFVIILRVFFTAFSFSVWLSLDWGMIFAVLAAIGMTVGNIIAIPQTNIKRMLGYSSIAQASYLMVGLAAMGFSGSADGLGQSGLLFFLISYTLTNLGAFIAVVAISNKLGSDQISDYAGMGKRAPLLALALTLCLVSLTGIPPAAGFMAKFYIFNAAVQNNLLWLVIIALLNSVISAYYYLRVVKVMWLNEPPSPESVPSSGALRLALSLCCLGVLAIGIVPASVMKLAELATKILVS